MTAKTLDPTVAYVGTWTTAPPAWFTRADSSRLRYVVTGDGPPLVLLHTVRTQLDYFQRVIPLLAEHYRVYALDFPGMGWSDIRNGASYGHDDLQDAVVEFVRGLELTDATLVGESIGAAIALTASVELGSRVNRVVASNTYDYPQGLQRANRLARVIIAEDWSRDADRRRTAEAIPMATVRTVENAGHFCAMEKPAEFVAAVLE